MKKTSNLYYTIYKIIEDLNDIIPVAQFDSGIEVMRYLDIENKCYLSQVIHNQLVVDNQFVVYLDKD